MTKIVQMEGYEIHHPPEKLKNKIDKNGGLSLKEIERRMDQRMNGLSEQFLSTIPEVIKTIETALKSLENGTGGEAEKLTLFRQGHDLKGMGASFGFPIMGTIGEGICELTNTEIAASSIKLPLVRVHLDLLTYVAAKQIKDDTDPNAAPILAALAETKAK
jgi:chemotaxis protein histidine kinase CheA